MLKLTLAEVMPNQRPPILGITAVAMLLRRFKTVGWEDEYISVKRSFLLVVEGGPMYILSYLVLDRLRHRFIEHTRASTLMHLEWTNSLR